MQEKVKEAYSGWAMLFVVILAWLAVPGFLILAAVCSGTLMSNALAVVCAGCGILLVPIDILLSMGLFTLQPNEAQVLVLFGDYRGTVRKDGFLWVNPFSLHRERLGNLGIRSGEKPKYRMSLRVRNFQTETLKVNDRRGNPIEIAAVVVWRVNDTAQALFDVDEYENYVEIQSESAVRHLASSYPYDHSENDDDAVLTLRGNSEAVSAALQKELQERLSKAGVVVDEARLTHLAYAPEIAGAMLRRQQAEAIISARKKIVQGAVGMVELALEELSAKKVVDLDEERKAAMVGNLLVVLCGETEAEPVINAGSLYH